MVQVSRDESPTRLRPTRDRHLSQTKHSKQLQTSRKLEAAVVHEEQIRSEPKSIKEEGSLTTQLKTTTIIQVESIPESHSKSINSIPESTGSTANIDMPSSSSSRHSEDTKRSSKKSSIKVFNKAVSAKLPKISSVSDTRKSKSKASVQPLTYNSSLFPALRPMTRKEFNSTEEVKPFYSNGYVKVRTLLIPDVNRSDGLVARAVHKSANIENTFELNPNLNRNSRKDSTASGKGLTAPVITSEAAVAALSAISETSSSVATNEAEDNLGVDGTEGADYNDNCLADNRQYVVEDIASQELENLRSLEESEMSVDVSKDLVDNLELNHSNDMVEEKPTNISYQEAFKSFVDNLSHKSLYNPCGTLINSTALNEQDVSASIEVVTID